VRRVLYVPGRSFIAGVLASIGGCSPAAGTATLDPNVIPAVTPDACCFEQALAVVREHRVARIDGRRFTPNEYWGAMAGALDAPHVRTQEIGRSVQDRPLTAIHVGRGPVTVLAWSQMHGDESTASMALLDVMAWLAAEGEDELRDRLLASVSLTLVPMLNPDGAELFQRHNALGIDVNRDARRLATPEGRALKALRDSLRPDFGFNLHDQNARQVAGDGGRQVGIALLAPAIDSSRRYDDVRSRARLVAARIARHVGRRIPGQVARYDDAFNPRAFGDLMQAWGTSTVLIESGALEGDPEKQRLRELNAAALIDAFIAIGEGTYASVHSAAYDSLPENRGVALDVVVRGARVVGLGPEPYELDLGLVYGDPVARTGPRLGEVGDLSVAVALDTVDAEGLFLHPGPEMVTGRDGRRWLRVGSPAQFTLRRGADASSEAVGTPARPLARP
jgi:hypothetical protein